MVKGQNNSSSSLVVAGVEGEVCEHDVTHHRFSFTNEKHGALILKKT